VKPKLKRGQNWHFSYFVGVKDEVYGYRV